MKELNTLSQQTASQQTASQQTASPQTASPQTASPQTASPRTASETIQVGWREWLALPELGIHRIKAKIDTGARTSCLHTFELEPWNRDGEQRVRFLVHPIQGDLDTVIECDAAVIDQRWVTDSGGHKEERYVIRSFLSISGDRGWPIELTLTNRDNMKFRMLLGRTAMQGRIVVNPQASYLLGGQDQVGRAQSKEF